MLNEEDQTLANLIALMGMALVPLASVALRRDWDESGPDMIDGPDLALTPKHVRAARRALEVAGMRS